MRSPALAFRTAISVGLLGLSASVHSEPSFGEPDMAAIFNRVTPHFNACAGSPIPGMVKGEGTYRNDGFDVGKPEMVMPAGSGVLSAMVSYGNSLELQLSDTGYFNAVADNQSGAKGAHVNSLLSPGHIAIEVPGASARRITKFDERIDFARGSVVIEFETAEGKVKMEIAGDMKQDNLVISVKDNLRAARPAYIRYENWRDSMVVTNDEGMLRGEEAADISNVKGSKAQSMSLALQIGCVNGGGYETSSDSNSGSITVPPSNLNDFTVIVSVKCAHGKPPMKMAADAWSATAGVAPALRENTRLAWWKDFWSRSWLDLKGPEADYLSRLWFTTLYSYACVGEGPVVPKFNGGPGLVFKDARSWGDSYWWQNQREISFWPMLTAGHPEFTRQAILFFNYAFDNCRENARHYKMDGTLFLEGNNPGDWRIPFGEGYPLVEHPAEPFDINQIKPLEALNYRENHREGYNAMNYSAGLEFTKALFDYLQYEGDHEMARKVAAPWLKGEVLMCLGLLTRGADHKYHIECADATEQWWKINDPAPMVAGVRYALEMTVQHGRTLGFEDALISAARERLDNLVPLPTVSAWNYKTEKPGSFWSCPAENIIPGDSLLAPFALVPGIPAHNAENPELYAVFPYAEVDLNSQPVDLEKGIKTFRHRFFKNNAGWSQCPVQAARLGLPDTIDIILEHAKNQQKWPYGGWNSPAGPLYRGARVVDCPFFDAAGVNMTALQESLLQSHSAVSDSGLFDSGIIRLIPAVSKSWSGQFLLHARGGFNVTVLFANGKVDAARFEASRDARLLLQNPFEAASVWLDGKLFTLSKEEISLEVNRGQRVVIAPAQ